MCVFARTYTHIYTNRYDILNIYIHHIYGYLLVKIYNCIVS